MWIAWTNKAIRDENGQIVEILCVGNDITARKESEKALKESERFLDTVVNSIQDGISVLDEDLKIIGVNQTMRKLYPHELALEGRTCHEAYRGRSIPCEPCPTIRALRTGKLEMNEVPLKQNGRQTGALELYAFPIKDESGKPKGVVEYVRDITDRKRAEKALQESEERFRVLFEYAPDPFYLTKMDGALVDVNIAAEEFTGYKKHELIGTNFLEIRLISEADLPKAIRHLEKNRNGEPTGPEEFALCRKNGEYAYAEISAHPVTIRGQQLVLGIARDIGQRKKAEEKTRRLQTQLRQTQKMEAIGTLAGGIAHDFNNILAPILGYTEMALDKTPPDSLNETYLHEVLTAGLRARDLVKQILSFSRQADQVVQPVQPKLIAKEAIQLLRASIPATIEIRQNLQSEKAVLADPVQIHQVLMNLCTNAGHAMREKGGILTVTLTDEILDADFAASHQSIEPGPHLKLAVSDTGSGMSAEVLERIFDPFFTTKEKGESTGLGLSVVHGIVQSCSGAITVASEPGKRSTFNVYLPVIERKAKPAVKIDKSLAFGNEHILFVDDEKPIVDLAKRMLKSLGYRVTVRTSSIEALELFKAKPGNFDLIITDLTMPNMTGKEIAREILHLRPDMPVILCTGFSEMITEDAAKAIGIRAFMMKPLAMVDFARSIRMVLDDRD